jgi:outer membrane protein
MAIRKVGARALLAVMLLLPAAVTPMLAQKVGYVASEAILGRLPEVRAARARLAELQTTWTREIQRQEAEIATLVQESETNRLLWSAQERREADAKRRDQEARLASFRNTKYGADGEYEREHAQLMKPVFDRIWKAIEEEARAQKVDIVLDKSSRGMSMLYANPEFDLTYAVLQRLGIKLDPSEIPNTEAPKEPTETNARNNRGRRGRGEARQPDPTVDPNAVLEGGETVPPPAPNTEKEESPD